MNVATLERTPYLSAATEPERPGVYECEWWPDGADPDDRDTPTETWFNSFDGTFWHYGARSPYLAACYADEPLDHADRCRLLSWRGITEAEARRQGMTT